MVDFDATPRHGGATALICGVGADLTTDLSTYEQEEMNSVFYLNPAQARNTRELLHNHGVLFSPLPFPEQPVSLEAEIKRVVDEGDFIDMRHLLDRSTIRQALFGVSYIQSFRRDPRGCGVCPSMPRPGMNRACKGHAIASLDPKPPCPSPPGPERPWPILSRACNQNLEPADPMKMTVADLILKHLELEGVEYIFGISGAALNPFLAAFNRNPKIKAILTKHEGGAAFMADGYARVKGSLGACFATSGPGPPTS